MKIKELSLIGFGKFNNKTIELDDGINIIYGENEAGKTTIHNFIDGMFYGFLKPYVKRTIYLDEHEKYAPWNSSKYAGIIRFTYDGKNYRIEREFTKGNEETLVLLDHTGEDITKSIDNGSSGRVLQPGFHFFGFNNAVYSNTVSIKQLESRTEASLANEVRDKLINISTSLDDDLSIEKALEILEKSLKDIGSIRATTSLYGRTHIRLEKLKEERENILKYRNNYENLLEEDSDLEKNLEIKEKEFKSLEDRLKDGIILDKYNIYREAKSLEENIFNLKEKAKKLEGYKDASVEDYNVAQSLSNRIDYLEERYMELNNSFMKAKDRLKEIREGQIKDGRFDHISEDYMKFEELEERKNKELHRSDKNNIEFLIRDYENTIKSKNTLVFILGLSIILTLGSLIIKILGISSIQLWINILTIPISFIIIHGIRKRNGLLRRIKSREEEVRLKEKERLDKISEIEDTQDLILKKYKFNSKLELKRLYDENHLSILKINNIKKNIEESKNTVKDLENKIQAVIEEKEDKTFKLKEILNRNSSTDLDDFKEALDNKTIYTNLLSEIKSKKDLLNKVLGKFTLESLETEIENYPKDIKKIHKNIFIDEIEKKINEKREEISNIRIEKKGIEERLNNLNTKISKLVEIDEEILRKEDLTNRLDNKRTSIELAMNTIESLSKDIHRQFAPSINRKVGEIIENITGGKYKGVKIDDNLEMGVVNPITREIIDINSLSGGTIDQLYFSLRFGIIDSIKHGNLPLILDDCFIQYDDIRLRNMMNFLIDESKNRQIILFTCHKREIEALKDINAEFNLITLT